MGSAQIFGERRFSMRVWLSAPEMAARGLTVQDVESAIQSRNVEVPAGRIESDRREFSVRSLGELKTPLEFEDLVVTDQGGQPVRLKDLGRVELGPQDDRSVLRFKGNSAVAIGVVRQSKANLIQVAQEIRNELPAIQASLPPGVAIETAFDGSEFVTRSISEAQDTLLIAAVLVIIIIFVFLRNLRATIIPGLAIPTSIIATFAVMYFLGFSINNLTLLALTLAIGIVVDDAIIVLENAYRHQEELHESPEVAATNGTREIAFAVIATTISLVAVFTPLAFLQGNTGRLFNEFGIAVAGSVIISGFVALTLTPMLCAKVLRVPERHGVLYQAFENGFRRLTEGYTSSLAWALRHRLVVVLGAFVIAGMAWVLFNSLKREFIPADDQGWFMTATIAPEGSSLSFTDGYQKQVEQIISKVPEVESYFGVVNFGGGVNNGLVFTKLKDYKDRKRTVEQIIGEVQPQFFGVAGPFRFRLQPPRDRRIREAGAVRGAESRLRRAGRDHGHIRHPGAADSRAGQHRYRSAGQQAAINYPFRPRPGRGPRRAGRGDRQHAADHAGRPQGQHLYPGEQAVRRDGAARSDRTLYSRRMFPASMSGAGMISWSSSPR